MINQNYYQSEEDVSYQEILPNIVNGVEPEEITITIDNSTNTLSSIELFGSVSSGWPAVITATSGTVQSGTTNRYYDSSIIGVTFYRCRRLVFDIVSPTENISSCKIKLSKDIGDFPDSDAYLYDFTRDTTGTTSATDYDNFTNVLSSKATYNTTEGYIEFELNSTGITYINNGNISFMVRDALDVESIAPTITYSSFSAFETFESTANTQGDSEFSTEETSLLLKVDSDLYLDDGSGNIEELYNQGGSLLNPYQDVLANRPTIDGGISFNGNAYLNWNSSQEFQLYDFTIAFNVFIPESIVERFNPFIFTAPINNTKFNILLSDLGRPTYKAWAFGHGLFNVVFDELPISDFLNKYGGRWNTVICRRLDDKFLFYVNGEYQITTVLNSGIYLSKESVAYIGATDTLQYILESGFKIDELVLDRRAYSLTEINNLYKSSKHYKDLSLKILPNQYLLDTNDNVENAYNLSEKSFIGDFTQTDINLRPDVDTDGSLLWVDGDELLTVSDIKLPILNELTVSMVVYLNEFGSRNLYYQYIGDTSLNEGLLYIYFNQSTSQFDIRINLDNNYFVSKILSESWFNSNMANQYATITGVFKETTASLYINSTLIEEDSIPDNNLDFSTILPNNKIDIGKNFESSEKCKNIFIYPRALSDKEVLDLHNDIYPPFNYENYLDNNIFSKNEIIINSNLVGLDASDNVETAYNLVPYSKYENAIQSTSADRPDYTDNYIVFGNDTYLQFEKPFNGEITDELSLITIINPPLSSSFTTGVGAVVIGDLDTNTDGFYLLVYKSTSTNMTIRLRIGADIVILNLTTTEYDASYAGTDITVFGNKNNTTFNLCVNGVLCNTTSVTETYTNSTEVMWIGGRSASTANFLPTDFKIKYIKLQNKYISKMEYYNIINNINQEYRVNTNIDINSQNVILDSNQLVETAYNKSINSKSIDAYQDTAINRFGLNINGGFKSVTGNDYLKANILKNISNMTTMCWFKVDNTSTLNQYNSLLGNSNRINANYTGFTLRLTKASSNVQLDFFFGDLTETVNLFEQVIDTETNFNTLYGSKWVHYAVSFDSDNINLYLNGLKIFDNTLSNLTIKESSNVFTIGARLGSGSEFIPETTQLEAVRYIDEILPATEIYKQMEDDKIRFSYLNN